MAERVTIAAEPRTILGKQVKQLRRQGRLPANIYGKGLQSVAIDLDAREFGRTIKASGVRGMFDLRVNGEPETRPVVIRGLTRAGGTGDPIHIDFYQVDPNRPIQANVLLRLVGEAPAVKDLAGTLLQNLDFVSVRCRPLQIPEFIDVDTSVIKGFDVVVTVGDVVPPEGVEILTDPAVNVATVTPPRIRAEDLAAEEEAEAEEA